MKNTGIVYHSTERTPTVLAELAGLLPPLSGEQLAALEADLLQNGCYSPVIVNEELVIVDGHNRYEICNKLDIPYEIKEQSFSGRDEVIAWICANQLGRRNISEEPRKYLIGRQYEAEKKVQRNGDGYNQYRPNPCKKGRHTDEESGRRTAARLGKEHNVSGTTVLKYSKYSAALDAINQNAPELTAQILSGAYKISYENIIALSEMDPQELRELSRRYGKNPLAFARYSESRRSLSADLLDKPVPPVTEQPTIKSMPAYDPDAEVAGLTLTIPS